MQPGFSFVSPAWLLLFLLLAGWGLWLHKQGLRPLLPALRARYPALELIQKTAVADGVRTGGWFAVLIASCLVLALAQPVWRSATSTQRATELNLLLVIDTSINMVQRDYVVDGQRVNRLDMTKALLSRFIRQFRGTRIGLIAIGSPSAVWLPPTPDHALAQHFLQGMEITMSGRHSALGDALMLAADTVPMDSPTVVVLVTDAAHPAGKHAPNEGAQRLATLQVPLYVLGVGAAQASTEASAAGELLFESVDLAQLERLAELGSGQWFYADDFRAGQAALAAIETRHLQADAARVMWHEYALAPWARLFAMLLLLLQPMWSLRQVWRSV